MRIFFFSSSRNCNWSKKKLEISRNYQPLKPSRDFLKWRRGMDAFNCTFSSNTEKGIFTRFCIWMLIFLKSINFEILTTRFIPSSYTFVRTIRCSKVQDTHAKIWQKNAKKTSWLHLYNKMNALCHGLRSPREEITVGF